MKSILARRILTLNLDFALARFEGRDTTPFLRRARTLSAAYLALGEVDP